MRIATWIVMAAALAGAPACGPKTTVAPSAKSPVGADIAFDELDDAAFAAAVGTLVSSGEPTRDRSALLIGVVRRQLDRAALRYASGHDEAALESVTGALYLVRGGELYPQMFEGKRDALLPAAHAVARTGNEGRAAALYEILGRILPKGADLDDVKAHLGALKTWRTAIRGNGNIQAGGDDQREAVDRALFEPDADTLNEARKKTGDWIVDSIRYGKEQMPPRNEHERDEAVEAYRAVRTGALVLTALYLRYGDVDGALQALDDGEVGRVVSPNLHEALRRAAEGNDPDAWFELYRTFESFAEPDSEVPIDRELARGAAFGAAVELYRAEPMTMRGVMPLSAQLLDLWMGEAAIPLLVAVNREALDPRALSWTLSYLLNVIVAEEATANIEGARRAFAYTQPVMDVIRQQGLDDRITPSVARVEYAMGALESRAGALDRARKHLERAVGATPTIEALRLLAAIDRQRGAPLEAVKSMEAVIDLATQASDVSTIADSYLVIHEIQRDVNNAAAAESALGTALHRALDARNIGRSGGEQAQAERVLARVLEIYGDVAGARRATERAYDASTNDVRQLTVTVLEAARRALTHGDLETGRGAVRRALDANLADEDVVYVALWLKLLEGRLSVPSDGTTEEAFATIDRSAGWASKLRAWATGRLDDGQLYEAARGQIEQTEALFYSAMSRRNEKSDPEALNVLKQVAASEAIQLVEVTIARDVVARERSPFKAEIPSDVKLP